ncbi:hypothetical protein JHN55_11770 [Streptomyces sp. MBT56]|nr:hypothetical protein [Streptomyces sp. MBT56]MBK3600356.1 hypothetical protein [Streptomyces sp. MBT54]MBK3618954.1 hypothetical protein [Streptomyces sp. MBT98]MBK6041230.1 hypothetical protein [Streptomyces sp. MBT55]
MRRYNPAADARARLLCLPHAGGSASFYLPLSRALGPDIDVLTVQYPGRQDRAGLVDGEALAQVPEKEAGMGAGWINTVRLGSEAIAVSLFGSLFASFVGSAAQASRQGFAAITVGSTLFAAVIGVWSVVLMRRGRHGEARPGEPGRTVEDAQDTAGTAPR